MTELNNVLGVYPLRITCIDKVLIVLPCWHDTNEW